MIRVLIGSLIVLLVSGCDTLTQDRDVAPRLTLVPTFKNEQDLIFSFEMYSIEQVNSFACEILFDSDVFETYTEPFVDNNNNGGCEYDEEYYDCGLDKLCNEDEPGYNATTNPDPNIDDYDENDPYNLEKVENNGIWDDNTIIFESAFAAIPHFAPISKSEYGKLSILGALVELEDGLPLVFEAIDSKIATIHLKIKQNVPLPEQTMITFGNWQLLQEDGVGAYFGGMVLTDTLFIDF